MFCSYIKPRVLKIFSLNYLIEKVKEEEIVLSNNYVKSYKFSSLELKITSSQIRL